MNILIGLLLGIFVASAAWKASALNLSGALTAAVLGMIIFGLGGLGWAILLLTFFISSSILSRMFKKRKAALEEKFSKGSRRDAGQVLANGGAAGLFVLLHTAYPQAAWPWLAFAASLASANADTWATELGTLSRATPRLITTGKPVEPGTSGGISLAGTLAALGGSLLVALLAVIFWQGQVITLPPDSPGWLLALFSSPLPSLDVGNALFWFAVIGLAGLAGSLLDSLLGATLQAIYLCPHCQKETERHPLHICGTPTTLLRGKHWMNNDWVNIFCTLAGAALAILIHLFR